MAGSGLTRWGAGLILSALVSLGPVARAEEAPGAPGDRPAASAGVLYSERSRLPYPTSADRWADALSTNAVTVSVPGAGVTVLRKQAVLVYRPALDRVSWEELTAMYVNMQVLPESPQPKLNVKKLPEPAAPGLVAPAANAFDERIYRTRLPGEHLALGTIRNLKSQNLLVYAVLLNSKLDDAQALLYAHGVAESLAEEARQRRMETPPPPGGVPAAGVVRISGEPLRRLQASMQRDPNASGAVKRMASVVLPQALSLTRRVWRVPPMSDRQFFDYYTAHARRVGWGAPISQDETSPGRPTLLFQRPGGAGVVLVRAEPTPIGPAAVVRQSTTVHVFEIDGNIDVSVLVNR
jgi:hypothetical protein